MNDQQVKASFIMGALCGALFMAFAALSMKIGALLFSNFGFLNGFILLLIFDVAWCYLLLHHIRNSVFPKLINKLKGD